MLFRPLLPDAVLFTEMHPTQADPTALHPDEHAAIARAVIHRQQEYAAGRMQARALLREVGAPVDALLSDADRVPCWPSGVVGSITHCRSLCAVAVAASRDSAGIGIDVEPLKPLPDGLLKMVLRPNEHARIQRLPTAVLPFGALLVFSIKEAVYKAIYPQRRHFLDFQEVEITFDHGDVGGNSESNSDSERSGCFTAQVLVDAAAWPGLPHIRGRYRIDRAHVAAAVVLPPAD